MVLAFQITRHFAAQKSTRDRMIRIPAQSRAAPVLVYVYEQRTGIRAVKRAYGMTNRRQLSDADFPLQK
jgi:hypothetical protein